MSDTTGTRKSKRALVFSPTISEEKRFRVDTEIERGTGMEACNMEGDVDFDVAELHECILTRINEAISQSGQGQGKSGGGDGGGGAGKAGDKFLMQQLVPAIVTSVAFAVGEVMKKVIQKMPKPAGVSHDSAVIQHLQKNVLLMKYENDKLEQYSRRETLKIVGVKEEEGEDIEKKVLDIFKATGADVSADDLSTVHRSGDRKRKGRPVLVRFISRRKRKEVLQKKKTLKDKKEHEGIFMFDDLTTLRARMLHYIKKKVPEVEHAWSIDGRIHCTKRRPPGLSDRDSPRKVIVIDNPDDLFKLGVDSVDFEDLGLASLLAE